MSALLDHGTEAPRTCYKN